MSRWLPILALLSHAAQAQEPPPSETEGADTAAAEQEMPSTEEDQPVHAEDTTTGTDDDTLSPEESDDTAGEEQDGEGTDGEAGEEGPMDGEPESPGGPSELPPLPYEKVDAETLALEQAMAKEQLERYCKKAQSVVIAQVLSVFELNNEQQVSLMVEEKVHGRSRPVLDIRIPAPIATDDPTRIYPKVVENYRLVVFLNRQGALIEGNSLFLYQGGFAWRNKRPDAFLQPSSNQDWVEQVDPSQDYIVFSMDEIRACLE